MPLASGCLISYSCTTQLNEQPLKSASKALTLENSHYVTFSYIIVFFSEKTNRMFCTACDPKLMPSFPQHRNMKSSRREMNPDQRQQESQSNDGLSDLVCFEIVINFNNLCNFMIIFFSSNCRSVIVWIKVGEQTRGITQLYRLFFYYQTTTHFMMHYKNSRSGLFFLARLMAVRGNQRCLVVAVTFIRYCLCC